MIEVQNLCKYFGPVMAIDNISFQVDRGELVGFLGLNGAGKTTTMRILTSFLPATSGIARVAGYDVMLQANEVRQNIGYLPENVPLYPEMRVDEYVMYRAKLKGMGRTDRIRRVEYCLDRCRLSMVRRRLLSTLSKGYRQRVGLADAMINDPPILILDEPTSGLDPVQIRETLALLRELGEKHTVLLSTHILSEVEAVCERVIIIAAGRVGLNQRLDEIESESRIIIEVRGPADAVTSTLKGVDGVVGVSVVQLEEGLNSFEVMTTDEKDLREETSQAIANKGWRICRLERKRRKLEDAFFEVQMAQDPLKAPDAPAPAASSVPKPVPPPVAPPPAADSGAIKQ